MLLRFTRQEWVGSRERVAAELRRRGFARCLPVTGFYQEPRLAIRNFAQTFDSGQEQRISVDYDPTARLPGVYFH